MKTRSFFDFSFCSRALTLAATTLLLIAASPGCGSTGEKGSTTGDSTPSCEVPADSKPTITLTKIGNPTWEIVDFHQFSAECGMNYDQVGATTQMILPEPNHKPHPMLGIGPGAPHAGPYDHEFSDGLKALGIVDQTVFAASDATWPKCIYATWMVVPSANAPMGSSPDSTSGPIIPNTLFPIHSSIQGFLDSAKNPTDPYEADIPALDDKLAPPFSVDGHSHFPWFLYEDTNTLLKQCGDHEFKGSFVDTAGNGWSFAITFYLNG